MSDIVERLRDGCYCADLVDEERTATGSRGTIGTCLYCEAADALTRQALTNAELRSQLSESRSKAMEEAAGVAEALFADPGYHPYMRSAAHSIAHAIRTLKDST